LNANLRYEGVCGKVETRQIRLKRVHFGEKAKEDEEELTIEDIMLAGELESGKYFKFEPQPSPEQ